MMRACVCALWVGWSVGGWSGRGTFLNQREGEKKEEEATRMRMGVEEGMEWGVESGVLMMMKREGGRRRGGGGHAHHELAWKGRQALQNKRRKEEEEAPIQLWGCWVSFSWAPSPAAGCDNKEHFFSRSAFGPVCGKFE